jgi:SAM-dependent methyltransferase
MDHYTEKTYGDEIAEVYDQWYSEFDPQAIETLTELAHGGKALELGIGTGRIALPLSRTGVSVQGIDISEAMVAKLRGKPGGDQIPVSMGNFAEVPVDGEFDLIYIVFNTFFSLLTQEEQVHCFQNVARHLATGGVFVIEAFVPDLPRFTGGQAVRTNRVRDDGVEVDVSEIESDKQLISTQHVVMSEHGTRLYPIKIRYVWPSEMDLMAQLSHLQLRDRWSDWGKNRFTSKSVSQISVYEHQK